MERLISLNACTAWLMLFILCWACRVNAQDPGPPSGWDDWLLQLEEQMTLEQSEQLLEEHQQQQISTRLQKLELNRADRQDLQQSGLFSPAEIDALLEHRLRYGPLLAWYELQAISVFSPERLSQLAGSCEVIPGHQRYSWRQSWLSAQHVWLSRSDINLPLGAGYAADRANTDRSHYAGSPLGHRLQYRQEGLMHKFVLSASRDPGEVGFDRLGGHLQLQSNGRLKRLVMGDYHLQWGEGLIANTGFGALRSVTLDGYFFPSLQLKGASGLQSFGTYRGVIAQWRVSDRMHWVPWLFNMNWSSSQDVESDGTTRVRSINRSGLHRTPTERFNRQNLPVHGWGTALHYQHKRWQWILGIQKLQLAAPFSVERPLYKQLQPIHPTLWHLSASQQYRWKRMQWQGEWAWQLGGEMAVVQQVYAYLPGNVQWRMAYRHITPGYQSHLANSLQRGSDVTNESGWLTNVQFQPHRRLVVAVMADIYRYPWMRYLIDAPAAGMEQRLFIQWQADKYRLINWQSRFESFERNQVATVWAQTQLHRRMRHQLQFKEQLNEHWQYTWQWSLHLFAEETHAWEKAHALLFKIRYEQEKWRITGQFTLFDAPHYDNRFFFTEPDVLYGAGMSQLTGAGQRVVLLVQYRHRRFDCWLRYAYMRLSDREQLGSGLDQLPSNFRHQLRLQCQWKHGRK